MCECAGESLVSFLVSSFFPLYWISISLHDLVFFVFSSLRFVLNWLLAVQGEFVG